MKKWGVTWTEGWRCVGLGEGGRGAWWGGREGNQSFGGVLCVSPSAARMIL